MQLFGDVSWESTRTAFLSEHCLPAARLHVSLPLPMGKRLVITEKPSVARDIVSALGGFKDHDGYWESDDLIVTFAVGHLLELVEPEDLDPKYKRWTLDTLPILPENFPLRPKPGTQERLRTIKKLLARKDVGGLVNACDAGREGELIFREIAEYLESNQPVQRLWLQSMTKKAIVDGFETLEDGSRYEGLSAAAHCRNYSDWLIGMNATRALTRRLKSRSENQAWSAGRVQTPTLAMLVRRELEVLGHRPIGFWRITGTFEHLGAEYRGTWFDPTFKPLRQEDEEEDGAGQREDRIFDESRAKAIAARLLGQKALAEETRRPSREAAPPLFDLTSLQREANRRFGWSARRTLNAAQRCYESHKILTYPRTDSRALPKGYRSTVEQVIETFSNDGKFAPFARKLRTDGLMNAEKIFDDSKISDHFAIVPTGVLPGRLDGDDARLFDIVALRFFAAFYPAAVWSRVERITVVDGEHFRSRAKTLQVPGWREVFGDSSVDEAATTSLPHLVPGRDEAKGVSVEGRAYELEADETRPPPRINEGRLLSLMENAGKAIEDEELAFAMRDRGIGTPATRADTIENLISKGYVMRAGRVLRPTTKGIRLIDILERMRAERLASPALTGELEHLLSDVEHGRSDQSRFMREVYDYTREIVELAKEFEFDELYPNENPLGQCPLCARPVFERSWFYRCLEPEGLPRRSPRRSERPALSEVRPVEGSSDDVAVSTEIKEPPNERLGAPAGSVESESVSDCPFRIWKDKSGRYIDRRTVEELLRDGKSRVLSGFSTRQGRTYDGVLELVEGETVLVRTETLGPAVGEQEGEQPGLPEYEVDDAPLATCPTCGVGEIVETRSTFICSRGLRALRKLGRDDTTIFALKKREIPDGEYCSFLLPRTVCRREITRAEASRYLAEGKTELLTDFISQRGRPFSATLVLKENGRHGFEFPPRGSRSRSDEPAESEDAGRIGRPGRSSSSRRRPTSKPSRTRAGEENKKGPRNGRGAASSRGQTGHGRARRAGAPGAESTTAVLDGDRSDKAKSTKKTPKTAKAAKTKTRATSKAKTKTKTRATSKAKTRTKAKAETKRTSRTPRTRAPSSPKAG